MIVLVLIAALVFGMTLGAVRVTQKITKELSWLAALKITLLMMMVYTFIVGTATKENH